MVAFFAVLLARFLDPISILVAGISGYKLYKKPFWYVFVIGSGAFIIIELILNTTQYTRTIGDIIKAMPIGIIASSGHAFLGRLFGKYKNRK